MRGVPSHEITAWTRPTRRTCVSVQLALRGLCLAGLGKDCRVCGTRRTTRSAEPYEYKAGTSTPSISYVFLIDIGYLDTGKLEKQACSRPAESRRRHVVPGEQESVTRGPSRLTTVKSPPEARNLQAHRRRPRAT